MTTSTKETADMVEKYDLAKILSHLQDSGLVLLPTDTVWSIACDASDLLAIHRLKRLKGEHHPYELELLVSSIDMLKQYTAHLHPRLETLLFYHTRPLTIVMKPTGRLPESISDQEGTLAIRLVKDVYCRSIIDALGFPLLISSANSHGHPAPPNFGSIRSDVIEGVDYVARYGRKERADGRLAVMVRLTDKDELLFLRE